MHIKTARLVLRDFVPEDWRAVLAYQRDPRYLRFYDDAWANRTDDQVRAFVEMLIGYQQQAPRRKFQLAITLDGQLIGNCGIRRKDTNDWEADIGYELAPAHWGRGYATEAARAMVRIGFDDLHLHRVSAWCIADNVASARVLEKAGLRLEGRLRQNEFFQDRWWDTLLYAVLSDEWSGEA
jgi:RimJ/RimL family protein N-acetyltransferase